MSGGPAARRLPPPAIGTTALGRGTAAAGGTHARIHAVVRRIPRGRVATYGQVALLAGLPRQARLVGYALHALPAGSPLPWHRVLGAGGAIRLGPLDGAADTQRLRLAAEGVRFEARGRVPLDRYGWRPGERAARSPRTGVGTNHAKMRRLRR